MLLGRRESVNVRSIAPSGHRGVTGDPHRHWRLRRESVARPGCIRGGSRSGAFSEGELL